MLVHRGDDGGDAIELSNFDLIVFLTGKVAERECALLLAARILCKPIHRRYRNLRTCATRP